MTKAPLSSLLLLILGTIFLLNNLGYLPWSMWTDVFKFWPILLIVIGLETLFTKNGSPRLLVAAIILIIVLPFVLQGQNLPFNLNFFQGAGGTSTLALEKKLGTLIGSKVNLDLKSGDLKINSSEKTSTLLVKGNLGYSKLGKTPSVNFDPKDGIAGLDITAGGSNLPVDLALSNWDLAFSQVVPLQIVVKSSSGNVNLDVQNLEIEKLNLDLGKTNTVLVFGRLGSPKVEISASEGQVVITAHGEKATKISLPEGSQVEIATRFTKSGDGYLTEDFDKAKDKLEININPGNAKVVVN